MATTEESDGGERRHENGTAGLARDSRLGIGGAIVRQISVVGVTLLIARVLGATALGLYSLAFALRALLVLLSLLGMRTAMTYFVALFRADDDPGGARGAVHVGLSTTGIVSVIVAAVTIAAAPALADQFFKDPAVTAPIQLAALSLPFVVVTTVALAATQGFKTMRPLAVIGFIFEPVTRLILTGAVLALGLGVEATLVALLVSSASAAALALRALRTRLTSLGPGEPRFPIRTVSNFAVFSWVASTANQGLLWADIIVLGVFVASDAVGVYQVATRVVLLAIFMVAPLTASLAPRVTDSWRRDDRAAVRQYYRTLTSWTWRLSLPLFVSLVVFTDSVLRLFGDEFASGRTVALTLVLGALIEPLAAPAAVVLNQVGKNRLNMVFAIGVLTVDLTLAILLIPILGTEGAAIAWAASLLLFGFIRILTVRRLVTGCLPWSSSHTKGVIAALVALVVGWVFAFVSVAAPLVEMIAGGLTVAVVYFGVLWLLGVSHVERRLLRSLLPRVSKLPILGSNSVRRFRDRRATQRLDVPVERVRLDHLISPLRYDILVRTDLFRLARANRDLIESDMAAFVELAKQTSYFVWFCEVAVAFVGVNPDDPSQLERGFARRVKRSIDLMVRYEEYGGFDNESPVTVRRLVDEETPTGKYFREERIVPVDGCHRLALLYLDGREYVEPSEYRVTSRKAPLIDNTPTMIARLRLGRAEYYRFIGAGYLDGPVESREDLIAKAGALGEDVCRDVAMILAVDERYLEQPASGTPDCSNQAE